MAPIPTYVVGLDDALGGGIPEGNVVLLSGTPGTMKSTLAFSILYHNARVGRRGLYVTLEERSEDLWEAMDRMGMSDVRHADLYLLDIGRLRLELSEAEGNGDWFAILRAVIDDAVTGSGYSLLVLDSLDTLYALEVALRPRRELFHLFGFLKEAAVTTFVISEVPFGAPTLTDHGVDFLADGILLMKQLEMGESEVELRVRCVKMRKAAHERGYFTLDFTGGRFTATKSLTR